jgi:predicted RNase H-like nuclease (RuvC/YqgF family)
MDADRHRDQGVEEGVRMKIVGVDPGVSTGLACFSSGYFIDGSVGMNYDEIEEYILSRARHCGSGRLHRTQGS